jgi:putative endonuclease
VTRARAAGSGQAARAAGSGQAAGAAGSGQAKQARGAAAEAQAARWYEQAGYEVLARNWRCAQGELDLVLGRGPVVVFCEVKSRSSAAFGLPAEAVTAAKRARLRRLAASWLDEVGARPGEVRFDVVAVLGDELEVIEGAF